MKRHVKLLSVIASLVVGLVFISCGGNSGKDEEERLLRDQQKMSDSLALKIATLPTLDCLPIFIAKERGIFDNLHVDVKLMTNNAQMDGDEMVKEKSVEGLVTDLVRAERLRKYVALDYVAATNAYWQLIVNRTARITNLDQLGDKMVAMTRYSVTDYLTNQLIDSVKPKNPIFKIQINDVVVRLKMLVNNEMDAMFLTEPQASQARGAKHQVLMDSRHKNFQFGVIAFRSALWADSRRKLQIEQFIKAYDMACDSISKNGYQPYTDVLQKYCFLMPEDIGKLPKLEFRHASTPRQTDIEKAQSVKF